jgi:DNA replication protein DnaC
VLGLELAAKQSKHLAMRISMARFPFQKSLEVFDWSFQPSIDPKIIKELATGRFIAEGANVLLLGPPGVGKTHLAVALGLKACELGLRTMFTTAAGLIASLGRALYENRLEERLKLLTQPKLLIIDEIGYIPIDRQGANLFFQLISRRYERGLILLTSNQSLGAWGEVFGDTVLASAILDRLLHHATTVHIRATPIASRKSGVPGYSAPSRIPNTRSNTRGGEFQMSGPGEFRMSLDIGEALASPAQLLRTLQQLNQVMCWLFDLAEAIWKRHWQPPSLVRR